jgi:hypothetical protein
MVKNNSDTNIQEEEIENVKNDDAIASIGNEARFIGSLFINNDLFIEYEKVVVSKYYFSEEFCLNLYDWLSVLSNNGQAFTEKNLLVYVREDEKKLSLYKKYGGWKAVEGMIEISDESEFQSYFNAIQKWALLRELENKGFSTEKIRASKNFDKATTNDIYNKVRRNLDGIHTKVTSDLDVIDIGQNVHSMMEGFLERPSLGVLTFIPLYNDFFRGFRGGSMMAVGYPGNAGKTRFLAKIAAYHALIKKEKTLLMLNEMTEEELRQAVLVTVINNPEFQELHGVKIEKCEKDVTLGMYRDDNGNYIYRKTDPETGEFTETINKFKDRLLRTSREYRDVSIVAKWIEDNSLDKYLSVVNMAKDYTDTALEACIRKNSHKGFKFFAYDNLKNEKDNLGQWASLIRTTTILSEAAKNEKVFVYGSIQLTDDVNDMDALRLNSQNISASKGLRTVLDILVLGKPIEKEKYSKYKYIPTTQGYGEMSTTPIPLPDRGGDWKLFSNIIDKNRYGGKTAILLEAELNLNYWREIGILVKA